MRIGTVILILGVAYLASTMGYLPNYKTLPTPLLGGMLFTLGVLFFLQRS